jgi:hypothetical protein
MLQLGEMIRQQYEPTKSHNGHTDHASSKSGKTSPVIVVDPGYVVDPVHSNPPDQPPGPDPPRKFPLSVLCCE